MNRGTSLTYVLHALDTFTKREGHACVPASHIEQNLRLGDAVEHLRKARAEGSLPAPVVCKLQARPGWYWARGETRTHKVIAAMGGFISLHGHTRFKPGSQLKSLADDYRAQLESGSLDRDIFLALQAFPQWRWEGGDRGWGDRFRELLALSEELGHARVPTEWAQLTSWAVTQRSNHRAGQLPPVRRFRMEMIQGWEWQPASGMRERYLKELISYVSAHGTADVPRDYSTPDGFALGESLQRIRILHARGDLPERRVADLEAVPGWSWALPNGRRDTIRSTAAALEAFVQREGHAKVPVAHVENGVNLGANLAAARNRLKGGKLGKAMLEQLDAVHPGWRGGVTSPDAAETNGQACRRAA